MITVGDGFFSVLVTTMFVTLLMVAGGALSVALAVGLTGCAVYRARHSPLRLSRVHAAPVRKAAHG